MIITCKMCGAEVQTKRNDRMYCDDCRVIRKAIRTKKSYLAHRKEILARHSKLYFENREKIAARKRQYYLKNCDKYRARALAYYYKNHKEILEYRRKLRKAMKT